MKVTRGNNSNKGFIIEDLSLEDLNDIRIALMIADEIIKQSSELRKWVEIIANFEESEGIVFE